MRHYQVVARARALWLLPFIGCGDQWTVTGEPELGALRSAIWLDDEAGAHALMLSSQPDACDNMQKASELIAVLDADEFHDCELFLSSAAEIGDAYGTLMDAGAAMLKISLPDAPEESDYATADADGDDHGPIFSAELFLFETNPWTWTATEYTCDTPDSMSEYIGDLVETRYVEPASLSVSTVRALSLAIELEGDLRSEYKGEADAIGTLSAQAHVQHCVVEILVDPLLDDS